MTDFQYADNLIYSSQPLTKAEFKVAKEQLDTNYFMTCLGLKDENYIDTRMRLDTIYAKQLKQLEERLI